MKDYGKITTTTNVIIVATLTIVLVGALVNAIPILQQKANAQPGSPTWSGGGGEEAPDEDAIHQKSSQPSDTTDGKHQQGGESDTSGLHALIPAMKSSSHSDDASKK